MVLQNPFDFLVRDSDLEGMSDGWDNQTAYGELLGLLERGWPEWLGGAKARCRAVLVVVLDAQHALCRPLMPRLPQATTT